MAVACCCSDPDFTLNLHLGSGGAQLPPVLAVLYCIWEMSRVLSHTHLHKGCTFMRPGPEFPVQAAIGSGWACHRDPLFQNQPFLA